MELEALQTALPEIQGLGASLVAISHTPKIEVLRPPQTQLGLNNLIYNRRFSELMKDGAQCWDGEGHLPRTTSN